MGNGGCSPSAVFDYLQISPFVVPTVEEEHLAMRFYKAQPSAGSTAQQINLTYFDLVVSCLRSSTVVHSASHGSSVEPAIADDSA